MYSQPLNPKKSKQGIQYMDLIHRAFHSGKGQKLQEYQYAAFNHWRSSSIISSIYSRGFESRILVQPSGQIASAGATLHYNYFGAEYVTRWNVFSNSMYSATAQLVHVSLWWWGHSLAMLSVPLTCRLWFIICWWRYDLAIKCLHWGHSSFATGCPQVFSW